MAIARKNYALRAELERILAMLGDSETALTSIDESLALRPGELDVLQVKMKILIRQKAWKSAAKIAKQIQSDHPSVSTDYYAAGVIHSWQNNSMRRLQSLRLPLKNPLVIRIH